MDMIERVAKGQAAFDERPWMSMPAHDRKRYLKRAELAIRDMREPTEMMARIGYYQAEDCIKDHDCGDAGKHVWRVMIDEALKRDLTQEEHDLMMKALDASSPVIYVVDADAAT